MKKVQKKAEMKGNWYERKDRERGMPLQSWWGKAFALLKVIRRRCLPNVPPSCVDEKLLTQLSRVSDWWQNDGLLCDVFDKGFITTLDTHCEDKSNTSLDEMEERMSSQFQLNLVPVLWSLNSRGIGIVALLQVASLIVGYLVMAGSWSDPLVGAHVWPLSQVCLRRRTISLYLKTKRCS